MFIFKNDGCFDKKIKKVYVKVNDAGWEKFIQREPFPIGRYRFSYAHVNPVKLTFEELCQRQTSSY